MLVLTFKIWCTCLVLTAAALVINDYPKKPNGLFDTMVSVILGALATVDILLVFVLCIMAIWS